MRINQGDEISCQLDGAFIVSRIEGTKCFVRKIKGNGDLQKKETEINITDITEKQEIIGPPPILKTTKGEI